MFCWAFICILAAQYKKNLFMGRSGRYYIKPEFKHSSDNGIWDTITKYITENKSFNSVSGIVYKAQVDKDTLFFIGGKEGSKRATKGDSYIKSELLKVFSNIKKLDYINTNVINDRQYISETFSYKRAPFIGLLYSVGIITDKEI